MSDRSKAVTQKHFEVIERLILTITDAQLEARSLEKALKNAGVLTDEHQAREATSRESQKQALSAMLQ